MGIGRGFIRGLIFRTLHRHVYIYPCSGCFFELLACRALVSRKLYYIDLHGLFSYRSRANPGCLFEPRSRPSMAAWGYNAHGARGIHIQFSPSSANLSLDSPVIPARMAALPAGLRTLEWAWNGMNANEITRSPKLQSGSFVGYTNAHNRWDYLNVRPMCVLTLRQLHSTRSSRLLVLLVISFHSLVWLRLGLGQGMPFISIESKQESPDNNSYSAKEFSDRPNPCAI